MVCFIGKVAPVRRIMGEGYIDSDGKRWGRGKVNFTIWDGTLYEPFNNNTEKGEIGVRANLLDGSGARTVYETDRLCRAEIVSFERLKREYISV